MKVWTLKVKDLKFPLCKKQGAFFWRNSQTNKLHGFKLRHKLGLKKRRKQNKTKPNKTFKTWMGI